MLVPDTTASLSDCTVLPTELHQGTSCVTWDVSESPSHRRLSTCGGLTVCASFCSRQFEALPSPLKRTSPLVANIDWSLLIPVLLVCQQESAKSGLRLPGGFIAPPTSLVRCEIAREATSSVASQPKTQHLYTRWQTDITTTTLPPHPPTNTPMLVPIPATPATQITTILATAPV